MSLKRGVARLASTVLAIVVTASIVAAQEVVDMPSDDRPLSADFEEVFRIGSFEGETWETFGQIGGTAFDAEGNLYVFDRQASRVTVVDRHGNFIREVGQEGEGPGELRMPVGFTVMRDGRIVVADMGHRAYQLFDTEGEFERMVSMNTGGPGGGLSIRIGALAPDPGGEAIISGGGATTIAMSRGPGGGPDAPSTRPIERIGLAGEAVDVTTIAEGWQPPQDEGTQTLEGGSVRFQMGAGPRAFEPGLHVGALPDGGVAFADSSTYSVKVAGPRGGVTRVLRRPFEPRPVTERMQEAERERRLAELEAGQGPQMRVMVSGGGAAQPVSQDAIREMQRNRIDAMQFYPELPVLMGLGASWTGKLWAQRRGDTPTEPGPIDVFSIEGQYLGTFASGETSLPSAFGPDGLAAYVETDEFEVPVVVVRRLPAVLN